MTLQHRIVALAEGRQLEDLAAMLEREGATVLRCPLLSILDAPKPEPVLAWLGDLIAGRFSHVILLTGEGLRRLLGFAERAGLRESAVAALGRVRTITRGPKPVGALREVGLAPSVVAQAPTTEGVIAALCAEPLRGQTVGVQLYSEHNPPLEQFLEKAGANVRTVQPYVYAPDADGGRVVDLIEQLAHGKVDVMVFTSSPQVDRLFEVAKKSDALERLLEGFRRTQVAAVGPVLAENLGARGVRVDICPEQGFVMKNLVQLIKKKVSDSSQSG
jgi:uroporphyrinogen-III synthase